MVWSCRGPDAQFNSALHDQLRSCNAPLGDCSDSYGPRAAEVGLREVRPISTHKRNVVVLEASNRTGGHVRTIREGLADRLYADGGAEHFTRPGYELYRNYVKEFALPVLAYPHRENILKVVKGRMVSEQEAVALRTLKASGYNQREIDYITKKHSRDLTELYLGRHIEKIRDEYQPFGVGLDRLDECSVTDLLYQEGASAAAIRSIGSDDSALHSIWAEAIVRLRGLSSDPHEFCHLKGGNQALPDAFAAAALSSHSTHLTRARAPAKVRGHQPTTESGCGRLVR
jgi:monoamine oxidase